MLLSKSFLRLCSSHTTHILPRYTPAPSKSLSKPIAKFAASSTESPTEHALPTPSSANSAIYSNPAIYEAAFSFREIDKEVSFLRAAYAQHSGGTSPGSVLELGCGPALHSIGMAQSGVPRVVALDLNQAMLDYAANKVEKLTTKPSTPKDTSSKSASKGFGKSNARKEAAGSNQETAWQEAISFVKGDMRKFEVEGTPFDLVLCLLGTFSHMTDNTAALESFQAISRALRPGGIFILELAHPGDLFDGTLIIGDGGREVWEVPQEGDRKLLVEWGADFDNFDPVTQILDRTVTINVMKGEDIQEAIEEVVPYRQFTVQEIDLMATMSGMKVEKLYGEMAEGVDMTHEEAYRMIMVISKPGSA